MFRVLWIYFFEISHRYLVSPNHVIFWVWWAVSELASVVLLTIYPPPPEHGGVLTYCWSFLRWKAQPFRNLTNQLCCEGTATLWDGLLGLGIS